MEERIAHGVVEVEARTGGASAALRRVEQDFDRTMHNIDRQEAEVRLLANSAQFGKEIKKAKAELDELRAVKAEAKIGADTSALNRKIKQLEKDIAFINRMKATVDIDVDTATVKEAKSEIAGLSALEDKRNAAERKYHRERMKTLNDEARRRASLNDQRIREFRTDESAAHRMDIARDREKVQILSLQREYSKLTERIEALSKRHAFTKEVRAKLELDTAEAYAKMELTKAALNRLGGHPPVDIQVDLKRTGLRRVLGPVEDVGRKIGQGFANIPNMAVRLGPFTTSVKGLVVALGILGPSLVDVAGAATSLIGVLGTGLTGAAFIGGGVVAGLAENLLGVKYALTPVIGDFKIAKAATLAYHKAVLQYGKGSAEAATKQDMMNKALATMDPRAQAATRAVANLSTNWQRLTQGQANQSFIHVVGQYAKTVKALQPTLAGNANRSMEILDERLTAMLTHLRTPAAVKIFDSLGRSANNFLNPALDGLQHLGALLGRVAESAARLFGGAMGNAFKNWARGLDQANQAGRPFDDRIRRLGEHAKDLGRFFLELGRLIKNVMNSSADAGDGLLESMTKTMHGWNKFLTATENQGKIGEFFDRSADGARELYHTFGGLIGEFVKWAGALAPFVTGLLKGVNAVGSLIGKILDLVHLGGSVSVLASTLGALWAVGRIGSFITMVTRAAGAVRALGAAQTLAGVATGSFGRRAAAAGVPIRAVATDAAASAAAARAASGGKAAAPTIAKAGAAGAGAASGLARFTGALSRAVPMLIRFAGPAGIAAAAALQFGGSSKTAAQKLDELNDATDRFKPDMPGAIRSSVTAFGALADSTLSVKVANHQVAAAQKRVNTLMRQGKLDTVAGAQALSELNAALDARTAGERRVAAATHAVTEAQTAMLGKQAKAEVAQRAWTKAQEDTVPAMNKWVSLLGANNDIVEKTGHGLRELTAKDLLKYGDQIVATSGYQDDFDATLKELRESYAKLQAATGDASTAQAAFALAQVNSRRAMQGFKPMTEEAAGAINQLNHSIGSIKTAKIAMKFPDPRQARQVMQGMNSAISAGAPKNKVFNVAANSSSAEQALRRLNALKLQAKTLKLRVEDGDALIAIARVRGIKLPPKVMKMLHEGDPNVIAAIRKVLGIRMPPKTLAILGNALDAVRKHGVVRGLPNILKVLNIVAHDAASAAWNSIQNSASIVTKTLRIVLQKVGKAAEGGLFGFAGGGQGIPEDGGAVLAARQARAYREAERAAPTMRNMGRFNKPTLLVGEEHGMSEFVIATNPAYRDENIAYLRQAADALGVDMAAKGKGPKKAPIKRDRAKKYKVPGRFNVGGVPQDQVQKDYDQAKTAYDNREGDIKAARQNLKQARDTKKQAEADKAYAVKHKYSTHSAKKQINDANDDINKNKRLIHALTKGDKKHLPEATVKHIMDDRKRDLDAVKKVNKHIALLTSQIEGERLAMDYASKNGGVAADGKSFATHQTQRTDLITALRKVLVKAQGKAKNPQFSQDLLNQISQLDLESQETATSKVEPAEGLTLDDLIRNYGLTDTVANQIRDVSLAAVDTPTDLTDDVATKSALRDTYKTILDKARSDPKATAALVTEAANAYITARDDVTGTVGTTPDGLSYGNEAAIADSAKRDSLRSFGGNTSPNFGGMRVSDPTAAGAQWTQQNPAKLAQPTPSGVGGTIGGGTPTVNKTINQTNNYAQPPADSHTFSQATIFELNAAF